MVSKSVNLKEPSVVQRIVSHALKWKRVSLFPPPKDSMVVARREGTSPPVYLCIPRWNPEYDHTITHWMEWTDENMDDVLKSFQEEND